MEMLTLPEPADKVWHQVAATVQRFFPATTSGKPGFALAGGTILAARWQHRSSADIDIKVLQTGMLQRFARNQSELGKLDTALQQTGFRRLRVVSPEQIVYTFEGGTEKQDLDFFEGPLEPPEQVRHAVITGNQVAVASNRQILYGKTAGRAVHAPVRDLFDLAVAATKDPEAAELAVNAIQERVLKAIPGLWSRQAGSVYRPHQSVLRNVPGRYEELQRNPVDAALNVVKNLRWRQIDIAYTPFGAIMTGYRPGHRRVLHHGYITDPEVIDRAFTAVGVSFGKNEDTNVSWPATTMLSAIRNGAFRVEEIKNANFDHEEPYLPADLNQATREAEWRARSTTERSRTVSTKRNTTTSGQIQDRGEDYDHW